MRGSDIILACYAIDSRKSFEDLKEMMIEALQVPSDIGIICSVILIKSSNPIRSSDLVAQNWKTNLYVLNASSTDWKWI
jgi:hypothetical protein